ncbi:MAG: nitronate monooxygenase [Dehalococcoidia bacterium]|nr:nitronate monooxygenase [Dehalococcoidia bacterium]
MPTTTPLRTRVTDMLGIDYPIFAFAHHEDVIVEAAKAGAIGIFGGTRKTPDEIREVLKNIRSRIGDLPFGIDLVIPKGMPQTNNREEIEAQLPAEHRAFVDHLYQKYNVGRPKRAGSRSRFVRSEEIAAQQLEVVLESDVNVLALGIGTPTAAVEAAKADGKTVVSLVGSPRNARYALDAGSDILVAQGYDAGGHTGAIGTFSLVPQIVDIAGGRPVLAAGGVATGRHIAASLALGAEGVWMGTPWLVTRENHTDPTLMKKLLAAGPEDTVISRADSGKTLRQIKSAWSEEWAAPDAPVPLKMPYQDILIGDLLGAIEDYDVEPLVHTPAGQGIAQFREETTVADLIAKFVGDAEAAIARLRG